MADTPFQKGYAACLGGFALGANPYYINSDAFREWNSGYHAARAQTA